MSFLVPKPKVSTAPAPPPAAVDPPPPPTPTDPSAIDARARAMRQDAARNGRQSTILTSPTGLQPISGNGTSILGS